MGKPNDKYIDSLKQNREMIEVILFICSVAYCFQSTITAQVLVAAVWTARALLQLAMDYRAKRNCKYTKDCIFAAAIFLLPHLIIHLYTMVLVLFGLTSAEVLSTNLVTYAAILLVIASLYLFGKNAMGYVFYALALSWFLCLIQSIFAYGPGALADAIAQGWFGISLGHENYLELDAVVLSVGYGVVLFLFSSRKTNIRMRPLYVMLTVVFLVGIKRISILAVLVVVICYLMIRKQDKKKAYTISVIAGWIAVVGCVAFIFVLSLGDVFYEFVNKLGIDVMARDHFHKYIMAKTEFSPLFLGFGRGSVKVAMMQNYEGYTYVHSDIIKMFFELGLIPFLGWLYYNLVFVAKCYKKEYGESAAEFYMLTIAYTFVLYLTDNTESYFVCILIRSIMPMVYAITPKETGKTSIRKL